jgi:GDP-L-fucose synthase
MIEKKILLTGSRGFLGRHLIKKLKILGFTVYESNTSVANLLDYKNLEIYREINFDYIIHLAAKTKAGDYCLYHKGEQWIDNQTINTNILKFWKEYQSQSKMIAMGTSCSYSPNLPLSEQNYMLGEPEKGLYTYALTKRMLLNGLESINHQYGLKFNYLIPSTLYGPNFDIDDSHFIFDLIKKIILGKTENKEVVLWGDGLQRRELIYIDDAVDIIIKSLNLENEVLNLGTGSDFSIKEYASKICKIVGYDENLIIYDTSKYVGVREKKLDIGKLTKTLDNLTFKDVDYGLEKTINFYIKNK